MLSAVVKKKMGREKREQKRNEIFSWGFMCSRNHKNKTKKNRKTNMRIQQKKKNCIEREVEEKGTNDTKRNE